MADGDAAVKDLPINGPHLRDVTSHTRAAAATDDSVARAVISDGSVCRVFRNALDTFGSEIFPLFSTVGAAELCIFSRSDRSQLVISGDRSHVCVQCCRFTFKCRDKFS